MFSDIIGASHLKDLGNEQFKLKNFKKAIELYTTAIDQDDKDELASIYANRSACYFNLTMYAEAFRDAKKVIDIEPYWYKGYQRLAVSLHAMSWYEAAIFNYLKALEFEPENELLKKGLADARSDSAKREEAHRKTNA